MPRRLLILGATGSIGAQALDVVAHSDAFELVGLSADQSWQPLVAAAAEHNVGRICLVDERSAARAAEAWVDGEVLRGADGLVRLVLESEADLVLNAIVGSAGLGPTVAALGEGIDLALANKESLVVGGELVMALAEATGAQIIPVDSEHSALHQLIAAESAVPAAQHPQAHAARRAGTIDRLVLTASGGPFRGRGLAELEHVTVQEALIHPTWSMGGKITIDSATLMNKGLELIEAHHLFGMPYSAIEVVVHPQSIVHAVIHLSDGSSIAQLGEPDMRVPISYALHFPERAPLPIRNLDLAAGLQLSFEAADERSFRCLALARAAALAGGTAPCVLNAANEVAVEGFLAGRLPFLAIAEVIDAALQELGSEGVHSFQVLEETDRLARAAAEAAILARR